MIYVDDMNAPYGNMLMCHMLSDDASENGHQELIRMADKIGVARKWIQNERTAHEHFDICLSKKKLAIINGAKEIKYGVELALILEKKKAA